MKSRYRIVIPAALAALVAFTVAPGVVSAQPYVTGQWSSVPPLPFFPVHTHVLPTGKVMFWQGFGVSGDPGLWDPGTQSVSPLSPPGYDLFCSGHVFLADGQLFVAGGHIQNNVGFPGASSYNASSDSWTQLPNMNAGRWYPTATILGTGDVLVVSGDIDTTVGVNTLPQVFQKGTGTWRDLTNAQLALDLYPTMLLAPNGQVFNAGPSTTTRYLDTSGTGTWSFVANRVGPFRDYGSAVMYADGKVLVMGGGDPPTNTAEVIDLNQATPTWRAVAPMEFARRHLNAVIQPDGTVLVTGGSSGPGFNDATSPVFPAELWDPATEQWTTLASASIPRLYHSATVLLPDGRVLSTGGNDYPDVEVYSPPYLFKGSRPAITSAPATIAYGQSFFVGTPDAASVTKVTMLRLSSTTHAFNQNQRFSPLSFSQATGGLNVAPPGSGTSAPPGHYLLFILNGSGVPSVAKIVQLAVAPQSFTLTVSETGSGAGTVTSVPAGITCGTTCEAGYASGTAVTLTATPAIGSTFGGWSGGGCSGTDTCTVTLTAATAVTATFAQQPVSLAVGMAGSGAGTVTSVPTGITCGTICLASFPSGTTVTLTAAPATGSTFAGWSGACVGTGTCTVTLTSATAVTAAFTLSPSATLTVSVSGKGTVTSAPAGINCGPTCSASYPGGTVVVLTATVGGTNFTFRGWSGACQGTGTCRVTMKTATTVTATFANVNKK